MLFQLKAKLPLIFFFRASISLLMVLLGNFPHEVQVELRKLRDEESLCGEESIDWKEFLAATVDRNVMMQEEKIRAAFNHFKQSDHEYIHISDLVGLLGGLDKAKELLGDIDADGDGKISYEDFRQMMVK